MREEILDKEGRRLNISGVLRSLGVSRSGFISWEKRLPSEQAKRKEAIKEEIAKIYNESHQIYGAPKITKKLNQKGFKVSGKTVGNYMREMGIKAHYVRPYTVTTIDPDFDSKLRNILDEEFNQKEPNAVWCSDITYIYTFAGFVYLTSIMDLFSRKIISWVLSTTLEAAWVIDAVKKAVRERGVTPHMIHADRGIQVRQEVA